MNNYIDKIKSGATTAFIDSTNKSSAAYKPDFISNDHKKGVKVLTTDYNMFTDPQALDKLAEFKNIEFRMYHEEAVLSEMPDGKFIGSISGKNVVSEDQKKRFFLIFKGYFSSNIVI